MATTWWLLVRTRPTGEAIVIVEYVDPEAYGYGPECGSIRSENHGIAPLHPQRTSAIGSHWTYDTISLAEYETYRDLHELKVLGDNA